MIRTRGVRYGPAYLVIGIAAWVAFFKSGVDPVVVGLVMGLLTYAYPATRASLEQASEAFRNFREQPTAELAQSARDVVRVAVSPNERLALLFHPWSSYVIVPLFALANAGIVINGGFLARAYTSPVTLGILIGYLVGKPLGTAGCAWLVTKISHGRLRPPVGWGAVAGVGAVAGEAAMGRIEARGNHWLRLARALDRPDETARRRLIADLALQRSPGHAHFRLGDFAPFVRLDLAQDVRHGVSRSRI